MCGISYFIRGLLLFMVGFSTFVHISSEYRTFLPYQMLNPSITLNFSETVPTGVNRVTKSLGQYFTSSYMEMTSTCSLFQLSMMVWRSVTTSCRLTCTTHLNDPVCGRSSNTPNRVLYQLTSSQEGWVVPCF